MEVCRLIVDSPAAGAWNMAVDEALLSSAVRLRRPTLRFYFWEEPTLSLGYAQPFGRGIDEGHSRQLGAQRPFDQPHRRGGHSAAQWRQPERRGHLHRWVARTIPGPSRAVTSRF